MTAEFDQPVVDTDRLSTWLRRTLEPGLRSVEASRIGGGNSSGAWRLELISATNSRTVVLKVPNDGGLVHDCDAAREGRVLDAARRVGAPVPEVLAIDESGEALGIPCFVMEHIDGHSVPEDSPASFHGEGWFRDADVDTQRATWFSFLDALAELHSVDHKSVPAPHGADGTSGFLGYWRRSLLDAAPAHLVPRQLAVIDWLADHVPVGGGDDSALCMGDARLGNALLTGTDVPTLVDFEVAYIGNPAADIGYCIMQEAFIRALTDRPATGIPSADETWRHWEAKTGRLGVDRDYWTAVGTAVLCVTATRAMLKWGLPVESVDRDNLVVDEWERLVGSAARGEER